MQDGVCSALTTLERRIKESAFGLLPGVTTWATPGVADADKVSRSQNQTSLSGQVRWPSPRATDGRNGGPGQKNGRGKVDMLPGAVAEMWPSPRAHRGGAELRRWASPDAAVMNDRESPDTFLARRARLRAQDRKRNGNGAGIPLSVMVLMEEAKQPDTPLSADWVEQLMGWPNGWTLPGPLFSALGLQDGERRNTRGKRRG